MYENGRKQTLSYPKYLVEIFLNRYLDKDETVDHIDGNFLNNDLSNLRVINRSDHSKQDVLKREDVECVCTWCKTPFTIKGNKLRQRNRRKSTGFCSKSCTGKYGKHVQLTGESIITNIEFEKKCYTEKSALEEILSVEEQNIGEALTRNGDGNTEA